MIPTFFDVKVLSRKISRLISLFLLAYMKSGQSVERKKGEKEKQKKGEKKALKTCRFASSWRE